MKYNHKFNPISRATIAAAGFVVLFCLGACKKAIDAGLPKTEVTSTATFSNLNGATAAMLGIYTSFEGYQNVNTTTLPGLSADELVSYSTPISVYYTNSLNSTVNDDFWSNYYNDIYQANNLIRQVTASNGLSDPDKKSLIAEAKFLRALFHFYLVNYFGDIPYITTSDYQSNALATRMSAKSIVYPMIVQDLIAAQADLPDAYPAQGRVRANKSVATALLARVYLYMGDWANAEKTASAVIANGSYSLESNINNIFLQASHESILQLSPDVPTFPNAGEGYVYILRSAPAQSVGYVAISDFLYNAFEPGDLRKTNWIGTFTSAGVDYHYAYKYKNPGNGPVTEYSVVLRLAEQYLIRAEARAQEGNVSDAVGDLNQLRTRAGLPSLASSLSQSDCLTRVMQERRIELFVEWGHRWLDLKRTGLVNTVMPTVCAAKGGVWKPEWQLYPIPIAQLNADPNMSQSQNPGY